MGNADVYRMTRGLRGFIRQRQAVEKNTFQDGENNPERRTSLSSLWAEEKVSCGKQEDQEEIYSICQNQ